MLGTHSKEVLVNDDFEKLEDNTKLKYVKEIYESVNSLILDVDMDRSYLEKLVEDDEIII